MMEHPEHHSSAFKTWLLIVFFVGIVAFQGWLAYTLIGDLGQPDWDYRPIKDVPGESAYAVNEPYHPLAYPQHVLGQQGQETYPSNILRLEGVD
jgi:hypothetical protein